MCKEKEFSFKGRVRSIKYETEKYILTFKGNAVNDNRDGYYAKCATDPFALNVKFEQEFSCVDKELGMMLFNCRNEELCVKFTIPDNADICTKPFEKLEDVKIKSMELIYGQD